LRRVALVTGAGSGIGRASAIALANAGFTVILSGRRRAPLEAAAAEAGNDAVAIPADVRDPVSVAALFVEIEQRFGRLDLLFNNAGVSAKAVALEELELDAWRSVLDTNLTGAFLCTQRAFELMKRQTPRGGRIINNGSISASVPRPLSAAYTAAKHGVTGLTRSTSLDGRPYDIACGQIDIGNAATELTEPMRTSGVLQPDGETRREPTIDVDHVARAVVYMATLPLDANVQFMTVMATKMPFAGTGPGATPGPGPSSSLDLDVLSRCLLDFRDPDREYAVAELGLDLVRGDRLGQSHPIVEATGGAHPLAEDALALGLLELPVVTSRPPLTRRASSRRGFGNGLGRSWSAPVRVGC
jgi:NAD(P)-dependent dehydrogenase (short-subunit alcohol dehydrogenase family)